MPELSKPLEAMWCESVALRDLLALERRWFAQQKESIATGARVWLAALHVQNDEAALRLAPHDPRARLARRREALSRLSTRCELSPKRWLSPVQRAVLVLRYHQDRPDAEIAELLGCREATVRSHARRALTTLRALDRTTEGSPG